jgi:hypothetical protein
MITLPCIIRGELAGQLPRHPAAARWSVLGCATHITCHTSVCAKELDRLQKCALEARAKLQALWPMDGVGVSAI